MANETHELDKYFLYAAHQTRSIKTLLRAFFGFLERNTDFYEATPDACQHMVTAVFREFEEKHRQQKGEGKKVPTGPPIEEITTPGAKKLGKTVPQQHAATRSQLEKQEPEKSEKTEHDHVFYTPSRKTKKGSLYPNDGDGATFRTYKWTQTPEELEIEIPLCPDHDKSTVTVDYTPTTLSVKVGETEVVGGELADRIKCDEVTWTVEDRVVCVRAEKRKVSWWRQLVDSEPFILLKPILNKHAAIGNVPEAEMRNFQKTVVTKGEYSEEQHNKQFPDVIPVPRSMINQGQKKGE
eukprot:sb/3467506/